MNTQQLSAKEMRPTAMSLSCSDSKHIGMIAVLATQVTLGNSVNTRIN